ncbi:BQ2448_3702 [Microbotryum intermedium]|uniref:BQ2448_3702 protein n=1 Tax=Microbotryum intermedium TaxID=269621 RepID=A0A238FAQ7_9BASI|nr:BQ2448_3702 [Microbotryum intermedium]
MANLDLASTPNTLPASTSAPPTSAQPSSSSSSSSIIPTWQSSFAIEQIPTEILVQVFTDRVMIVVTQLGRIGSLVRSLPFDAFLSSLPLPHPASTLTTLLGVAPSARATSLYELYAHHLGAIVFNSLGEEAKPVVLGIALKEFPTRQADSEGEHVGVGGRERNVFREVLNRIVEQGTIWENVSFYMVV